MDIDEKETYYFVDTTFNWADEFDISGFEICTKSELEGYKEELSKYLSAGLGNEEVEHYFGSNESEEFTPSEVYCDIDAILKNASPMPIEDVKVVMKYFGNSSGGITFGEKVETIVDRLEDELENCIEEYDEEEEEAKE